MGLSIQDYLKKINSALTATDILSLLVIFLMSAVFLGYVWQNQREQRKDVVFRENITISSVHTDIQHDAGKPFGSKKGKTYTFSWCSGSSNIKPENKIYFASSVDAEAKGRTLSKLCKR